jgi:membrane fusion protein, multidrug efflux system
MKETSTPNYRRLGLIGACVIMVIVGYSVWHGHKPVSGAGAQFGPAPSGAQGGMGPPGMSMETTVAVGQATLADMPVYQQALGTVVANASVTVTSRVDGLLQQVYFTEGQYVQKGQLLAQIDPSSYQATLNQYQGELAQNQAQLKSAQLTLARYKGLYAKDSLARQDLDSQVASVGQYQGAVQASKGQIDAARLNLKWTRIESPIDGYVGLRLVDPGNMIHASDTTGIVTVTQINPISVTFSVPQAQLPTLLPGLRKGETMAVKAIDQLGNTELASGRLKFISNEIDTATGSVKLKAEFANSEEKLYPNQLVNVKLQTSTLKQVVSIPAAAVQLGADGSFTYVVKADGTVERRIITTSVSDFERTAVLAGVAVGEQVVTRGIDHLRDGSKVKFEQSVQSAAGGSQP